jgi:transaldolase
MTDRLKDLSDAGVSIWLDDLSRRRLNSGNLAELVRDKHVVGVTSNPTIFAAALANAEDYDAQLRELAERGASVGDVVRELTTTDVRNACDLFREVWQRTGKVDGRVSLEVDPRAAHRTDESIAQAADLWKAVDRPNLMIKVPATDAGLPAITATLADGISVNVTLIFSVERYRQVMDAFMSGLEQAKANGHDLSSIGSVASFFVSRVDTEVDSRLDALNSTQAKALRGTAAVANAQLAYQAYAEVFSSDRWQALADAGAKPQRPLWASTGTKNPDYKDTIYVEELIAPGTVNTMPESVIKAYADHGETRGDTVTGSYAAAQKVMDDIAEIGVDLDDVFRVLEDEGVEKFEASWAELVEDVEKSLKAAAKGSSSPSDAAK